MAKANRFKRGKSGTILGGKSDNFSQKINMPDLAPRASLEQYWHPNRAGVEPAPEAFAERLRAMHPDLACCKAPGNAPIEGGPAWTLWYKRPRVTHHLCPGWLMLFSWRDDHGVPQQLDERIFAVLYGSSALKFAGGGKEYFERAIAEKQRERRAARDRAYQNHRKAKQREWIKSTRISTAGNGSKFARHHDGTLQPSRASLNWHAENRRRLLPSEMIQAEDEQREQSRATLSDLAKVKLD